MFDTLLTLCGPAPRPVLISYIYNFYITGKEKTHGPQKKMRTPEYWRYNMLDRQADSSLFLHWAPPPAQYVKPVFFDAKENYTKNITMPSTEEIKAFAEAEGFEENICSCRELNQACNCEYCGNAGVVYIMHGVTWPSAAIEMMMAAKDMRREIASVSAAAVKALHTARGGTDYRFVQQHLNVVHTSLMQIHSLATGSAD